MTAQRAIERTAWQPGDPLYLPAQYSQYVYNFRDDPDTEVCSCGDAASWPEPASSRALKPGDEIGELIDSVRAERARAAADHPPQREH